MKNAIYKNYRVIFVLLVVLAISGFEMTADLGPSSANVPIESPIQPEVQEQPLQTFMVTSTGDGTGAGTLRTAITNANANPGLDMIAFNISGGGTQFISILSPLPAITDPVNIDGTTQPGYAGEPVIQFLSNGTAFTSVFNITGGSSTIRGFKFFFFSGMSANQGVIRLASNNNVVTACTGGNGNTQVVIDGGSNNRIGGSVPADRNIWHGNSSQVDIVIVKGATATGNRIVGNWFGTTPAGAIERNVGKNVFIDGAPNNFVGGTIGTTPGGACTGECNLISGGTEGVRITGATATLNTVIGNFFGTDVSGTGANRNDTTIRLVNAPNNRIGGSTPSARNVMGATFDIHIFVEAGSNGTIITGNYIGLKPDGASAFTGSFVAAQEGIRVLSNNNRIGGVTAGERNVISGSQYNIHVIGGFNLIQGNYIGTNAAGDAGLTTSRDGILVEGPDNTIGTVEGTSVLACTGGCNLISGNGPTAANNGILLIGPPATRTVIDYNFIGLNATGTAAIRNGLPVFGRSILILNSNSNRIGSPPLPSSRPSTVPLTDVCVQDAVSNSYVRFDSFTGEYSAKDCRVEGPPSMGTGRITVVAGGLMFNAAPIAEATVEDSGRGGGSVLSDIFQDGSDIQFPIDDNDISNNGSCTCPGTGYGFVVGEVEVGGGLGGNLNIFNNIYSGITSDLSTRLSVPGENGFRVTTGTGNAFTNDFSITIDTPNISTTPLNHSAGSYFFKRPDITPHVSNGDLEYPIITPLNLPGGNIMLTGNLTADPGSTYRIDAYSTDLTDHFGQPFVGSAISTGVYFMVTTNAAGVANISETFDLSDAFLLKQDVYQLSFSATKLNSGVPVSTSQLSPPVPMPLPKFDFDEDGETDFSVFRPGATANALSYWYVLNSNDNTVSVVQFGNGEDKVVTGDFNGDHIADYAVFRPSNNTWYNSQITGNPSTNFDAVQWGITGDIPVKGDFNGDGLADPAVYRGGVWYVRQFTTGNATVQSFGLAADKPVPADYNGDGRTDIAVYRDGIWHISVCPTCPVQYANFGLTTDKPVPADYDFDGKADVAVFRPSDATWYILQSSNQQVVYRQFGVSTDIPVPGDYDADGKTDVAIWRPADGDWWVLKSSSNTPSVTHWGQTGDVPVPSVP